MRDQKRLPLFTCRSKNFLIIVRKIDSFYCTVDCPLVIQTAIPISKKKPAHSIDFLCTKVFFFLIDKLFPQVKHCRPDPSSVSREHYSWSWSHESIPYTHRPICGKQDYGAHSHAQEFLKDFIGWLCCDGYEAYHHLGAGSTVYG